MRTSKTVLFAIIAGLLFSTAGVSSAQDQNQKPKNQAKQSTFTDSVTKTINDLTADQKAKIDELRKAAGEQHKKINAAVGLSFKMNKKRQDVFDTLSTKTPWKERNEKACKEAGFNQAQMDSLKDSNEAYRSFRYQAMQILTAEQQKKMPKWYQEDYKKSVEMADKKAKEEAAKKEAEEKAKSDEADK